MKTLFFDCFAGISGDMTVAALLDLGVPLEALQSGLAALSLPAGSYRLEAGRTSRHGIGAMQFIVHVAHHQPHRHYRDIAEMIDQSRLPARVKERAQLVFLRLAEAEARVHGVEIDRVHFHEVGGVDSIVDIVGTAICLEHLGIGAIHASPLPLGSGYVETAHGRLPVPAPATAELLKGIPVHGDIGPGERVTPTGAAIAAALSAGFGGAPAMTVRGIGCGAGSREFADLPNILRVVLGETSASLSRDEIVVAETHIDDMNTEILGYVMERLLQGGALDVAFSPLQMKKNRPGVKLTILSSPEKLDELARLVLRETTAAGVRYYPANRLVLGRAGEERETSLGRVRVKSFDLGGEPLRMAPEFEECRRIAEEKQLPLREVYAIIEREACGR